MFMPRFFLANTEYIEILNSVHGQDPVLVGRCGLWGGTEIEESDQSRFPPSPHKLLSSATVHVASQPPRTPSPHPVHQPPHQDSTLSLATNRWGEGCFSFSADFDSLAV